MVMERNVILYRLALPVMWVLTLWVMFKKTIYGVCGLKLKVNTVWCDGSSLSGIAIKKGAASWQSLDIIYNFNPKKENTISLFWLGMINAQAVRNRLKMVTEELYQLSLRIAKERGQEVRIFSIACGSAQAVIEVISRLKAEGIVARALLTDLEEPALEYAKRLAAVHGVSDQISVVQSSASRIYRLAEKFQPTVVEMVGLMDYLPHKLAVQIVRQIYRVLGHGGFFITCNISNNLEKHFLKWVLDWEMIYRSQEELAAVVGEAGFYDFRVFYEPHKVHSIVIAER